MPKTTKAKRATEGHLYSYDEYRRTFYPKPQPSPNPEEPEVFGARLAEEALRQLKEAEEPPPGDLRL